VVPPKLPSHARAEDDATVLAQTLPCRENLPHGLGLPFLLKPGVRLADFELVRLLGEGSFAQVFLARQISLERQVALKVTANQGSEARTLASLEHDHIVQVFGEIVDPAHNLRLLYMQYVPGTTLKKIIDLLRARPPHERHGRAILEIIDGLTVPPAALHPAGLRSREMLQEADLIQAMCWIGGRLAEALDYAHKRGVLHRDIKPANILISPYARPLLADFNLALRTDPSAAAEQSFGGTLAYMAPEHLDAFNPQTGVPHSAVDERSDVYGLGMVLYELLIGQLAFEVAEGGGSLSQVLHQMAAARRSGAPTLSCQLPEASAALDHVMRRCLAPEPADRYPTARHVAAALDGCRELRRIERDLPAPGPLTRLALRRPFASLALVTILPHLVGSFVNICYNSLQIVGVLTPAQQTAFLSLVLGYNLLVYPVCVALACFLVAPVWRVWREVQERRPVSWERMDHARRRALSWAPLVVWLSCLGWLPGGVLFPLWIHYLAGPLPPAVFGHFLISFTLSGLIALTYSFFGVEALVLRVFYPRLWLECSDIVETIRLELGRAARRIHIFQLLAGVIPLVGAVLMVAGEPEISGGRIYRLLVTALIMTGMAGFGLAVVVNGYLDDILMVLTRQPSQRPQRPSRW
jgi:serine/threonine protein kinase